MVMSGDLQVGAMLPSEGQMAKDFGVSRTVVREAVSRLKAEGLLSSQQGRGVFVASTTPSRGFNITSDKGDEVEQMIRIYELRVGVETEAAALAAARRSEADLDAMRVALDNMAAAVVAEEVDSGVAADMAFHRAVCRATRNAHYVALFDYLSGHFKESIRAGRERAITRRGGGLGALAEHRMLLDAIEAGDVDGARTAARVHVETTMRRLASSARAAGNATSEEPS